MDDKVGQAAFSSVSSVQAPSCSACSGLVSAVLGCPADVVKARIMNQPTDSNARLVVVVVLLVA